MDNMKPKFPAPSTESAYYFYIAGCMAAFYEHSLKDIPGQLYIDADFYKESIVIWVEELKDVVELGWNKPLIGSSLSPGVDPRCTAERAIIYSVKQYSFKARLIHRIRKWLWL